MRRAFDTRILAMASDEMTRHTLENRAKNGGFQRVAGLIQRVALATAKMTATLRDLLQPIGTFQRVAQIIQPTQWGSTVCNTATLLFSRNINSTHTHTYTYAYRGSIGTALDLLRPSRSMPVGIPAVLS